MKNTTNNEAQEQGKKKVKIPKFPKFYVLCDRQYYGLDSDDGDPRSSKAEVFYEDNVTHIFENEDEYVNFIKTQVVTDYEGLPMKDLCCKHFIGLDLNTISDICKAYHNKIVIEDLAKQRRDNYKEENYKNYNINRSPEDWRDKLYNVVKYVNLFNETSNKVIGDFILSHITNNKFYDLELTKFKYKNGWFYDIANYSEIVKDRSLPKKKNTQTAENQDNAKNTDTNNE